MKMVIFSIYDVKALAFITPFFLNNTAMAVRAFNDCAMDKGHMFNKHPEDYALYRLGVWDDHSAGIELERPPVNLGLASQITGAYSAEGLIPGSEHLHETTVGDEASVLGSSEG